MSYKPKWKKALWTQLPNSVALAPQRPQNRSGTSTPSKSCVRRQTRASGLLRAKKAAYNARVKVWLKEIGNSICHACLARYVNKRTPSTQCHHIYGRLGSLLMREEFWLPVCAGCHDWIHNREPALARELGLLAPKGQWNNPPQDRNDFAERI